VRGRFRMLSPQSENGFVTVLFQTIAAWPRLQKLLAKRSTEMAILGYAKVSTQDQNLTGQLEALTAARATQIYREKISGAQADRPQLAKLMASLKEGDVVLSTSA
jgi:predicted site-specific integrase-resolvase